MKKLSVISLPILAVSTTLIFGCNSNKDNRIVLSYGDINVNMTNFNNRLSTDYAYDLTYDELKSKIENKVENFILTVSPVESCTCWTYLSSIIQQYVSETNTIVYRIAYNTLAGHESTFGLTIDRGASTLAVIKAGEVSKCLCSTKTYKELTDYSSFKNFIDKVTIAPKMYFINEDDYFDILLNNPMNNAVVYLGRNGCGDCKEIEKSILIPYFNKNKTANKMYILDCEEFRKLPSEEYQAKKEELCLTQESESFGYGTGVFPTLYYIDNATIKAGAVAYNETIEQDGENYKVSESYFSEKRLPSLKYLDNFKGTKVLDGLKISKDNVSVTAYGAMWDKSHSNNYYKPLINAFLDYSLNLADDGNIRKTPR